ncbi:MAG: rhodanese-related sulfurtransferase [Bradymonadia bacterium]|jgi:rhodanese-related sulfurtransferase
MRYAVPILLGLLVATCAHSVSAPVESGEESAESVGDRRVARTWIAEGAVLIDVRSAAEFGMGHLADARNIPLGRVAEESASLSASGRPVVVYCLSGHRSARAASQLRDAGVEVYDLGSLTNW